MLSLFASPYKFPCVIFFSKWVFILLSKFKVYTYFHNIYLVTALKGNIYKVLLVYQTPTKYLIEICSLKCFGNSTKLGKLYIAICVCRWEIWGKEKFWNWDNNHKVKWQISQSLYTLNSNSLTQDHALYTLKVLHLYKSYSFIAT